ncbi:hypothetical protein MELB17_24082 [Marinobacter sp. ELB17]|nr:hypothetical protein MELB17_24082 [Marinobacter sp. ELB17]
MNTDKQAINFCINHLIGALVAAIAFIFTADWVGLRAPEGPTALSIILVATGVVVAGVVIYRGVTVSKKIARCSPKHSQ